MKLEQLIQYRRLIDLRTNLDVYEQKSVNQMLSVFDKATADLKKRIKRTKSFKTKAEQKKLLRDLKAAHKTLSKLVTSSLTSDIVDIGGKAFDGLVDVLSWDGKDVKFNVPMDRAAGIAEAIETVPIGGKLLEDWVEKTFDDTLSIQSSLLSGYAQGQSYRGMYQMLAGVYSTFSRRELITLTRTYNQAVVVAMQEKLFEENKDIVKKWRWTAVMEIGFKQSGRGTCPRCAALDGQEYAEGQPRPICPLHPRCRCMWAPITATWNELFEKHRLKDKKGNFITVDEMKDAYRPFTVRKEANIDLGRGKGNITNIEWTGKNYGDFVTDKGGNVLISVVGPNRARLIKAGKIKFSDLVDRETGELLTLKKLGFPITKKPGPGKPGKAGPKKPPKVPPATPSSGAGFDYKDTLQTGPLFKEAKTLKEAEEIASKMGMTAFYKGFDLDAANNVNESYSRMIETFPILKKQQMHVGAHNVTINAAMKRKHETIQGKLPPHLSTVGFENVQKELTLIESIINNPNLSKSGKNRYKKLYPASFRYNEMLQKGETITDSVKRKLILERNIARDARRFETSYTPWGYTFVQRTGVPQNGMVVLNKLMRTTEKFFQRYMYTCDKKFHPPLTASHWERAVFTHEFGHNIDGIIRQSVHKADWELFLEQTIIEHGNDFKNVISVYANKTVKAGTFELVAEAVADVMDDKGGSVASQKIVNRMFKILEDMEK